MSEPADDKAALFGLLLDRARLLHGEVRAGTMFGAPSVYVGRKLAACTLGGAFGLRVPEPVASAALAAGRATRFQPHGKARMREWIEVAGNRDALERSLDLLEAALGYAESNGNGR